jgi:molybdopterin synthase catalytic subunit
MTNMSDRKLKNIFIDGPIPAPFIGESIHKHSSKTDIGAHSIFLGQVRADVLLDKQVVAIDYTTYKEMALEKMDQIREGIFKKYELTCLHVHHSLGVVGVGEICLFVFASSKHRKSAITACEDVVEQIKTELPIWGKEIFEDDSYIWKTNR